MTRLRTLSTSVAWQPWGRAAFERARAERKPVLLSISADWCNWCRDMDRVSYADPTIATVINERFVPLRVDAGDRPDISERYSLGGWPTTAFLTADGAIAGGGTYVPVERMPDVLELVAAAFASHPERLDDAAATPAARSPEAEAGFALDALIDSVLDSHDDRHGGFGDAPKFPLPAPLRLALALRDGGQVDPGRLDTILVTTLDRMGWGDLYDETGGGFFRCTAGRDWTSPQTAKLLATNAALLPVYLDAGAALGLTRFTERGADILRYLQTWLADPVDGGWFASQAAAHDYYASADRRGLAAPAVSARLYADDNAAMASAALHAAAIFEDDGLRNFALKSLERVLLSCYAPGAGVAHYRDGAHRTGGLLADQVAMASACLDAFAVTEDIVYEMMAEELMHMAVRTMWNDEGGGFFDRTACGDDEAVGLMRSRLVPFVANCEAARLLLRLAATSGEHDFAERARRALAAVAPAARAHGPLAAHYVLAMRDAALR